MHVHLLSRSYKRGLNGYHGYKHWLRGTVAERWSLTGELSMSCARPAAGG